MSAGQASTPREVVRSFALGWRVLASQMNAGALPRNVALGRSEDWPTLARLLGKRAELLLAWAEDDAHWVP
jgi:hypothetical protein